MWMKSVPLRIVDVPDGVGCALPEDRCCNCGEAAASVARVTLRRTIYLVVGGFEQKIAMDLPVCGACERTIHRAAPGPFRRVFYAGLWSVLAWFAVIWIEMQLGTKALGAGAAYVVGLIVSVAAVSAWYATRRPRGKQTSYYQPVRLLGRRLRDDHRSTVLGFTNGEIADATGRSIGGVLPTARVVAPRAR
jgi:hypothetical protein